jgi:hypothetical protein
MRKVHLPLLTLAIIGALSGAKSGMSQAPAPPPTRAPDGPGAPHWTVVGAQSPGASHAAAGMSAPADRNGDFLIGPDYRPAPELSKVEGVPSGSVQQFVMESKDSSFYPGVARAVFGTLDPNNPRTLKVETHPQSWERAITVYIPAGYKAPDGRDPDPERRGRCAGQRARTGIRHAVRKVCGVHRA